MVCLIRPRPLALAVVITLVAGSSLPPAASAQGARPRQEQSAAREALTAGRAADAVRLADAVLVKSPGDRDAADVKIRALLSLNDRLRARRAYDTFVAGTKKEDVALLGPIATAELRVIAATASDIRVQAGALERLAKSGDKPASSELQELSQRLSGTVQGVIVDSSLARLGDPRAEVRLADAASSQRMRDRSVVADALVEVNARGQAGVLVPLLRDEDPMTRVRAAEALGVLEYKPAIPELRALLSDERPSVQATAALALKRLGDDSGNEIVSAMAGSPNPAARLRAIEASRSSKPEERAATIKLLAADRDPSNRIRAAELSARTEPASARKTLATLATEGDVAVRRGAARVLETLAPADVSLLHRLLGDADAGVRMHACGGVLAAVSR